MNITTVLEMAAAGGDRTVLTAAGRSATAADLLRLARRAAADFASRTSVVYIGANHSAYPIALFGAALAGVPFVPVNYRLSEEQISALLDRHPGAVVLRETGLDAFVRTLEERRPDTAPLTMASNPEEVAVVLYTSGTTAEPKAALLRHRHLLSYVLNTQEFGSAQDDDAALVAVPPYHVAGLMNLLTNLYTGRRVVYLAGFDAHEWLDTVRREGITHALVVPTMLTRIVTAVRGDDARTPSLRSLAYGGARTPRTVVERALRIFPETGFVNAYGLTETASSVAVLGPDEHRLAVAQEAWRDRLASVGRALPGVEIQVRTEAGAAAAVNETGLVFVRGPQISGEYSGGSVLDQDGWFATRDRGRLDAHGYLFIEGRADDTIIRGGENIAPAEIEDVLTAHPGIQEAAVVGVHDPEWGQRIVAVVVGSGDAEEIKLWVKTRLRSSKTPDNIVFRPELPKTETGKLLRRVLLAELESAHA